jgi:DNA-binding response OmpR family regulator
MERILVIDDEKEIVYLIRKSLEEAGYRVSTAFDGKQGLALLEEKDYSLVILDIMMPGMNGIDVCKHLRTTNNVPVIMVSAKSMEQDKIEGLVSGADDYIVKPFSMNELLARVQSQIRRYNYLNQTTQTDHKIRRRELVIDEKKHTVEIYGSPVKLTPTEYEILLLLTKNPGEVFSSESIYRKLWEEKYFEGNNTVMAHIWRLREKIEENPQDPKIITTVWGVGYKIDE